MSVGESASFLFYIDGVVAMRDKVTGLNGIDEISTVHSWLVDQCEAHGRKWMVEIVFADGEHVRWGTDRDGMVWPMQGGLEQLAEMLARRWG
jgi:hypothetical protein